MSLKRFGSHPDVPSDEPVLLENYGLTVFWAQLFEGELANLIMALQCLGAITVPPEARRSRDGLVQMCLGPMLHVLETHGIVDQEASEFLRKAQQQRNLLVHRFMLENSMDMRNEAGRASLNDQLERIYSHMRRAHLMVSEAAQQAVAQFGPASEELTEQMDDLHSIADDFTASDSDE
jgi:hypothetical protein